MRLHTEIKCCAKIGEQDLTIAPDQQVSRFHILVNKPTIMHKIQCRCCLFEVRGKFFSASESPCAIGATEHIVQCLRRVVHDEVGASIIQLPEIVYRHDIGMPQFRDASCL